MQDYEEGFSAGVDARTRGDYNCFSALELMRSLYPAGIRDPRAQQFIKGWRDAY